ncbi:MAG TPA: fluoride efflux transporter CrcB [Acidimicrobiales bacterium]|nr:fluoride efflux transporter CrcB [Acidimicrobiales bacterium]
MTALILLCVAAGGLVGAPARLAADRFVADRVETDLPLATFVINVSGSFLLGLLTGLDLAGHLPEAIRALVGTGFCGAYTTFSTWSYETVSLIESGNLLKAAANALGSLIAGLAAAGLGIALGLLR